MSDIKIKRAIEEYNGFKGAQTVGAVLSQVPETLLQSLTGKQIGQVMSAINAAYHAGKASTGADMIDRDCVWINSLNRAIEWKEIGAIYETKTIEEPDPFYSCQTMRVTKQVKVADGILVPNFVN